MEDLKQQLIESGVFRKDGTIDNHWIKNKSHNFDFSNIPGDTINEKLYIIFKGEQVLCPICGKPAKFIGFSRGYNSTCSPECKKELDRRNLAKIKEQNLNNSEKAKEKRKKTNQEKYGVDNPLQSKEFREKGKQTSLEKYGTEYPQQSEEVKNKTKATNIERYGVDNPSKVPEIRQHISEINKEIFKSGGEMMQHLQQKSLEIFGYDNPAKAPEVREKISESNKKVFSPDSKIWERQRKTMMERHGVEYALQSEEIWNNIRKHNLQKYNKEYTTQVPEIKHRMMSNKGKTKPEQTCEDYLISKGYKFEYAYEYNGKNFDFALFKENKLDLLIEIDGEYFHGLVIDPDGYYSGGYNDFKRVRKLEKGIKLFIVDSKKISRNLDIIDHYFEESYKEYLEEMYNSLPIEFPYYNFVEKRLMKDFDNLKNYKDLRIKSRIAESSILQFHKSIFDSEVWNNKELLKRMIEENLLYSSKLSSHQLLENFRNNPYVKYPHILSPSLGKLIVEKYLKEEENIYNPNNNFSSLLLASCALNKRYFCICKNIQLKEETQNLIDFHNLEAKIEDIFPSKIPNLITEIESEKEIDNYIDTYLSPIYVFLTFNEVEKYDYFVTEKIELDDEILNIIVILRDI